MYEVAWLAGLLDGEGCLTVRYVPYNPRKPKSRAFELRLEVDTVSTNMIEAMKRIYDSWGVRYILEGPRLRPKSTRPAIRLRITRKQSLYIVLKAVLPYLVVKHAEALRVLAFLDSSCQVPYYVLQPQDLTLPDDLRELKRLA